MSPACNNWFRYYELGSTIIQAFLLIMKAWVRISRLCSLMYVYEIGRYLTPKEILQKGSRPHVGRYCCPARGTVTTFWVHVCISYSDVIYTHAQLRDCEASRKAYGLSSFARYNYKNDNNDHNNIIMVGNCNILGCNIGSKT